jgi:SagB-type dehydrogenase family enzyme
MVAAGIVADRSAGGEPPSPSRAGASTLGPIMSDAELREVLRLRPDATMEAAADGGVTLRAPHGSLPLGPLSPGRRAVIERLADAGGTAGELLALHRRAGEGEAPTEVLALVQRLARAGWLCRRLEHRGAVLLVAHAADASRGQWATAPEPTAVVQLSRFACLRREGEVLRLESPLAIAQVELHDRAVTALLHDLACPTAVATVLARTELPPAVAGAVLGVLLVGGLVVRVPAEDRPPEDAEPGPGMWDPVELLAHHRSRHPAPDVPLGKTHPFVGRFDPIPALAPARGLERVALPRPDLADLARRDPPLVTVMESRRSQRRHGEAPVTLEALAELLFRTLRVRAVLPVGPATRQGRTDRPYPSAGACYPLEAYVAVHRCQGLGAGLWHYDPLHHALERMDGPSEVEAVRGLVDDAMHASGAEAPPQLVLVLTARFGRTAWSYGRLAHRLVLQEVGVVIQSVYLAATAMGLCACALGRGNATRFAAITGLDPRKEASVGEIMLGSAPSPA